MLEDVTSTLEQEAVGSPPSSPLYLKLILLISTFSHGRSLLHFRVTATFEDDTPSMFLKVTPLIFTPLECCIFSEFVLYILVLVMQLQTELCKINVPNAYFYTHQQVKRKCLSMEKLVQVFLLRICVEVNAV